MRALIVMILLTLTSCGKHETRRPPLNNNLIQEQAEILTTEEQALRFIQTAAVANFIDLIEKEQTDLNYQFNNGRTFLIEAVLWSQVEIIKWLLQRDDCDREIIDQQGLTAEQHAKAIGIQEIISLFQGDGLTQEELNQQLFRTIQEKDYSLMQETIKLRAEINIFDVKGMTPLITAIFLKDEQAVRILLQSRQADINLPDKRRRWTPLAWANSQGLSRVATQLQRMGAI